MTLARQRVKQSMTAATVMLCTTSHYTSRYFTAARTAFILTGESVITTSTPNCCAAR